MKINNSTIQKLTNQELNDLGCFSELNLALYQGNLKSKVKIEGKFISQKEICSGCYSYNLEDAEIHFIRLADENPIPQWAMRIWDKEKKSYIPIWNILLGTNFIK